MASKDTVVRRLLAHGHATEQAEQIYVDKIQYRPLLLRPSSPPPPVPDAVLIAQQPTAITGAAGHNGRDARRRARRIKQDLRLSKAPRPKPLSARRRRALHLYDAEKPKYSDVVPLHRLWCSYIREVVNADLKTPSASGRQAAATKLAAADMHGAAVLVTRSGCVGRVGIEGIVVRDTRHVLEVVTKNNKVKMVPKEGTYFRIEVPMKDEEETSEAKKEGEVKKEETSEARKKESRKEEKDENKLVFEILGSQFMHRPTDRANRKFKQHFYQDL